MSLALTETESGKFLVFPLLLTATLSSGVLIFVHCCENEDMFDTPSPRSIYEIV